MLFNYIPSSLIKKISVLFSCLFFAVIFATAQNVGIGTTTPAASALLEVNANNKGVLIPRMTDAQMIAIATPANGLLVYNTDSAAFAYRAGAAWVFIKGNSTASNDWSTKGNAGTDTSKNFIGTTDDADVIFKRNNEQAGWLNESLKNTSFGAGSLGNASTGFNNTAIGYQALKNNSIAYNNTAIGGQALGSNDIGSRNTATGFGALFSNASGNENAANGTQALLNNIDGSSNTASGFQSLFSNSGGFSNVAIGAKALYSNSDRSNLVAIGDSALYNNGTDAAQPEDATANTAVGSKALYSNNTGKSNTAVGFESLKSNTSGRWNTATGWMSMQASNSSIGNSAFGYQALFKNNGTYNVGIGMHTLFDNATGNYNTAMGSDAMSFPSSGSNNTAVGHEAGYQNTGSSNVFLGRQAGRNETGSNKLYISNDQTDSANTLIYGEFNNKILSIGGKLGVGTTTPENLLHLKNANTNANASQLIIEGNSNYGASTYAAIDLRSHNQSYGIATTGRIKSYNDGPNFSDSKMVFQTIAAGPVFVDALALSNGNVSIPNGSVSTGGNLSANGNLFAGGHAGIGISPVSDFPLVIKSKVDFGELIKLYNDAGIPKWHLSLLAGGSLNFVESGVADYRLLLGVGGEVGIGKVPLTSSNDSRLQVKQKGTQNGVGVEASNSTNHWDFYTTTAVASNFALYYNGSSKGTFDNVTGAYTANSDRRLKKDITTQLPVLDNLMQLQAYQYHYLDNKTTDRFSNGFMAQDVQKIFPDAVIENEMKDGEKRLGINYQYFTVLAIKGLQEQQKDIEQMNEQMRVMMEEIEKLKKK